MSSLATESSHHLSPEASDGFVLTPAVDDLVERALAYLEVGYSIHLAGPAGTGKTTLAFHIAAQRGRPVTMLHGNDEATGADWVGRTGGYSRRKVVDNFIHNVVRSEEEMRNIWVDNCLTTACQKGETLIYDEFNRSRPEANNLFLSVLGERILNLPQRHVAGSGGYIQVDTQFRAIFTSNPEEYAGTHKTQDALMDRLITINVDHYDRDTEVQIIQARSGIALAEASKLADILRELRTRSASRHRPTIRAGIAIARVLAHTGRVLSTSGFAQQICQDVLSVDIARVRGRDPDAPSVESQLIDEALKKICTPRSKARKPRPVKSS